MNIAGSRLAILGGGQLGKMLIQKAVDLNIYTMVLDPDVNAPCRDLCSEFHHGDFRDHDTVIDFCQKADVVTIEIEHVNVEALEKLADQGKRIYPQPSVIRIVQDKGVQKKFYSDHGIPTSEFVLVEDRDSVIQHKDLFPVMQKLRTSGYDGRGVQSLRSVDEIEKAFDAPSVLERFVDLESEISVIVSRNADGVMATFPVVELNFNEEANLVDYLFSPPSQDGGLQQKACELGTEIADKLGIVGILAVEMFVTGSGEILVNEMAPRPHNSGHHTIEANVSSQYENHLRAIFNLPPGDTSTVKPSVMINLLGEKGHTGVAVYKGMHEVMAVPGTHIHLYGKLETRPFRKMGHVTITGESIEETLAKAMQVKSLIRVVT